MYYLYIVFWGSFWLILFSEWYRCRETELFVAVTVRLMDWTLVNNSLYLRWLLYLLCSLYSLIIFSLYVCIHINYNSVENLHWQKLAETCFCRTGLNRGLTLNHLRQKPANPDGTPMCICINLTSSESRIPGLQLSLIVWVYLLSNFHSELHIMHHLCSRVRYSCSRSSKTVECWFWYKLKWHVGLPISD